ncbi:AsmA-like C-terminal region-containing protein [Polaribacter sp. Hel1_85]|uniref:AsmA-like C-terminal region-containing protein n=1 Tax=Polaribacter sp. Hel1_85 TaxID=1250005 RepID=UPI00052BA7F6|nr:AsmA-like C-terminal region-containing protein [Polaribacter sp. Hel1_85]KGL63177.1 outer membrane assembly protein [Polaribacter sp. Hel1_85]
MNTEKKKKSMGKRIIKWITITALLLLTALIAVPYVFKDKIVAMVKNTINNNINATVTFKDTDLSLFKNFPLLSLTVNDLAVANKAPFVGDTLFNAKALSLDMKVTELLKKENETIAIKSITSSNGNINIIFNKEGNGNFDIAKKNTIDATTASESTFSLNIEEYELADINFNYVDRDSNTKVSIDSIYHSGKGNFAEDIFNLDTKTTGFLSFDLDKTNYINKVKISLDAILGIDLKNNKYSFKENTGYINQLPLEFDGFIQLIEDNQFYDLHFKTPTSSFKNALALLPKQYAGNLKTIKTEGNFEVNGVVKGTLSDKTIPAFDINIVSKNALFKYADLPKSVKNINIDSKIINTTGLTKDTYVTINKLNFKIDEDVFSANGNFRNITTNPNINIAAKGTINLANIGKVYPAPLEKELAGILKADITTNFDMNSVDKGRYQNIKNAGEITIRDFKYEGTDVAKPFYINKTGISFNTNSIKLNEFEAKTGTSDLAIKGNLDNFYGFIFKDEVLKGNFLLNSNNLIVADFISIDKTKDDKEHSSSLKIPAFLDVKLTANAKKVVYDNVNLSNVSGDVFIHDEKVDLKNVKSDVFGGNIAFNGNVSTKGTTSKFKMDLNLNQLNVGDSFGNLEMLKSIAPIAKAIEGKMNSTITVSGNLNDDMTPNLKTISGNLLGQLLDTKLKAGNSKMLTTLGEKVKFLDVNQLNLHEATGLFSFENGLVTVKPIPLKYKDIAIEVGGTHGFDQTMNYDIVFDVPVKYLGTDVTNLISKLTAKDAASIKSIPVKGNLTGSFGSPSFTSNIKDATATLIKDLVEKQKNSLIDQGKDKLKDLIGIGTTKKDSIEEGKKVEDKVKDVLGNLFGKKKKIKFLYK